MSATHTPGPWAVVAETHGYYIVQQHAENRNDHETWRAYQIGHTSTSGAVGGVASEEANARLLAASPELLAACKRALPWLGKLIADGAHMNSVAPNDAVGAMEQMQAAIEKASAS